MYAELMFMCEAHVHQTIFGHICVWINVHICARRIAPLEGFYEKLTLGNVLMCLWQVLKLKQLVLSASQLDPKTSLTLSTHNVMSSFANYFFTHHNTKP